MVVVVVVVVVVECSFSSHSPTAKPVNAMKVVKPKGKAKPKAKAPVAKKVVKPQPKAKCSAMDDLIGKSASQNLLRALRAKAAAIDPEPVMDYTKQKGWTAKRDWAHRYKLDPECSWCKIKESDKQQQAYQTSRISWANVSVGCGKAQWNRL